MTRYECRAGGASKFWVVAVSGKTLTTSWGRIGTGGQSKSKSFAKPSAAVAEMAKLIREKTRKGYRPAKAGARPAATAKASSKPARKPVATTKANAKSARKPVTTTKPSKPTKRTMQTAQEKPTMTQSSRALPFPTLSAPPPRDGAYLDVDPRTGKNRASGQLVNGERDGEWCWFGDDGKLRRRAHYRAGVLDGAMERFHENGTPSERGTYRDGKRDGVWVSLFVTGNKQQEARYEDGLDHGLHLTYYPSGKLEKEYIYVRGKLQDEGRTYFEEGPVKTARTGENEPELIYFLDGTISREEPRREGRRHGKLLSYDEHGRPDWQCEYVHGVKHGIETRWNDGKAETTHWLCGVPASKLGPRELKAVAARFNKKADRYDKLDVLSEVTEGDGDNNRLLWHLLREGLVDVTKTPELWDDLADDDAFTSKDVVAFLSSLKTFDQKDSFTERFLPCWPAALDKMTCKAYARDPETIDAALGKLPKLVRDGVRTVRARFGHDEREHFDADITAELATQYVERGIGSSAQEVRWFRDGRLQEVCLAEAEDSARPGRTFYELIALFTTREAFLPACVEACLSYDRDLDARRLTDVLRIAPPTSFFKLLAADRISHGDLPFVLELREDAPATLLTWAKSCAKPATAEILAALAVVRLADAKQPIPESVDAFFTDGEGLTDSDRPWSALDRGFAAVSDEDWQDIDQKRTTDRLLATLCFGDAAARMPGAFRLYQRALAALPERRALAILHRFFDPENIRGEHAIALAGPYLSAELWTRIQTQLEAREPEYYGSGQAYALGLAALPAMALPWIFEAFSTASKKLKPFYERAMLYALAAAAERGERWPETYDRALHFGPFSREADGKFDSDYAYALRGALRWLPAERARPIFERAHAQKPQIALRTFLAIGSHATPEIVRPAFELLLADRLKLEDDDQGRIRWALATLGDDGARLARWVLAQRAKKHAGLEGALFPCLGQAFWDAREANAAGGDGDEDRDDASINDDDVRLEELDELMRDPRLSKLPRKRIYVLRRGEPVAGSFNQIGGTPPVDASAWPMNDEGEPMQFVCMLDLDTVPDVKQARKLGTTRALALFVTSVQGRNEEGDVRVVRLTEAQLARPITPPEGTKPIDLAGFSVTPIVVPDAIFDHDWRFFADDSDDDDDDDDDEGLEDTLRTIHQKVYQLHARAGAHPLWMHQSLDPTATATTNFILQLDEAFIPELNLGDAGIQYWFVEGASIQCH